MNKQRLHRGKPIAGGGIVKGQLLIDCHSRHFIIEPIQIHIATEKTFSGRTDICIVGCQEVTPESISQLLDD